MFEAIGGLLTSLRSATPVLLGGIVVSCGVVLFGPDGFLAALGILDLATTYRTFVGSAFLLSGSLLSAEGVAALWKARQARLEGRANAKRHKEIEVAQHEALHQLTVHERSYLAPFVLNGQNTVYFPLQDGVVGGLEAKKVLYRASAIGDMLTGFAFNLQPWAREHLEAHPELLHGADPDLLPTRGSW